MACGNINERQKSVISTESIHLLSESINCSQERQELDSPMDFIEQFLAIKPETLVARTANLISHTPSPSFFLILVLICLIVVTMFVVFLYGVFLLCRNTTPSVSDSPTETVTLVEGML